MKTADKQGFRDDSKSDWSDNEESRRRQLREDGGRSLAENLAEGLALSDIDLVPDPSSENIARLDLEALEAAREGH